jgi:glycine cleavage system T protein (aminomethyltransferase)
VLNPSHPTLSFSHNKVNNHLLPCWKIAKMLKTPLNDWHHANRGRMVDFAGWEMPVQYSSIVEEHNTVRTTAGLFDISHMGRLEFRGGSAHELLNHVLTNDVAKLNVDDIRYSLICRDDGGILDDVLVYRLPDRWMLVVNASNREKIIAWLQSTPGFDDRGFHDLTMSTAMIAVQGPASAPLVSELIDQNVSTMKYYSGRDVEYDGIKSLVSRTGYTGEDGFELIVPAESATRVWRAMLTKGTSQSVGPAGLGCRDTLRLEAAMPLYGHELSESIDPLTAGLAFAVKLGKQGFVGKTALERIKGETVTRRRVGIQIDSRRIAREGAGILSADGNRVGEVTSGSFSPTLQKTIAMGYVAAEVAENGTLLQVDVRGSLLPATVVSLPFYKRRS